ncbi:class I SAM-dependent methyltransferase [candidate division CSSED10-310 bacterium]|uniref:Class I SAM-dependent methyltransferase n=1 Tax=candidate division CSSED10-310 bacterium TaxID=2855610 RepID=A0ABV6YX42_UNCC1
MEEKDIFDVRERYRQRWEKYGYNPKTLGWNKGRQMIRFAVAFENVRSEEYASVLDVGCGFGDLFGYLKSQNWPGRYIGVDIVPELIAGAERLFCEKNASFHLLDIQQQPLSEQAAMGIALGVFNWKLRQDNMEFIRLMLEQMWDATTEVVVLDFLSNSADIQHEHNFYADPGEILNLARRFSRRVLLYHAYMPFEFQVKIWHNDSFPVSFPVFESHRTLSTK